MNAYGEKGGSNLDKTSKILKVVIAILYNRFHLLTPDIIKGEEDTDCGLCMHKCIVREESGHVCGCCPVVLALGNSWQP